MDEQLTQMQEWILTRLREYEPSNIYCPIMDRIYERLPFDVDKKRFKEDVKILEAHRYIVKRGGAFGDIGDYEITAKGLEHLRSKEQQ